jgi:uroporphyrinogen-III decarboxylase
MELEFARAQIEAGADVIGVGDAAASLVGPAIYEEFVWPYEKKLIDGLHAMGGRARLHICGNTRFALAKIAELGCEIVDIDFPVPLPEARSKMGRDQIILGNLNPVSAIRESTPQKVMQDLAACHAACGSRFVVGAGCEIPRDTPHENVRALAEYARTASV